MEIVIFVKKIKPKIKSHILCDKKIIWKSYAIIEVAASDFLLLYVSRCILIKCLSNIFFSSVKNVNTKVQKEIYLL